MAKGTGSRPDQETKDAVTARILAHARKNWPDTEILVRHNGAFCYVAVLEQSRARRWNPFTSRPETREPFPALRLRYRGSAGRWLVGIYQASTETYSEDELPTVRSNFVTTPEEGMNHVLGFWIHPPAVG